MNRVEFQQLADERIADAHALLGGSRWSAAYYLVGYAVECALKACIARLTNEHDFPHDRRFVEKCYSHDIEKLVDTAGLQLIQESDANANPTLGANCQRLE